MKKIVKFSLCHIIKPMKNRIQLFCSFFTSYALYKQKNELFNFKRQARFAENLERCSRLHCDYSRRKWGHWLVMTFTKTLRLQLISMVWNGGFANDKVTVLLLWVNCRMNNANAFNQTARYVSRKKDEKGKIITAMYLVYF